MTDEDVVRLFVAGRSTEDIIAEIERREPGFDLSPDMIIELGHAGLPEDVIQAMVRRQEELREPEPAVADAPPRASQPMLHVLLNPERSADEPGWLTIRTRVDPRLAAQWELGNAPEDRVFAGLALYLACQTAQHVPDHWRSETPLGRDFFNTPRHRILAFEASIGSEDSSGDDGEIRLRIPRQLDVALEPEVAHDLILGIAVQVGGRYYNWTHDLREGLIVEEQEHYLTAQVQGRSQSTFAVRFQTGENEEQPKVDDDSDQP